MKPIDLLLSKLHNVKRDGKGYRGFCPAHDDEGGRPSLTISEGVEGKALVKCWTRDCSYDAIVKAAGLTPEQLSTTNGNGHTKAMTKPKAPPRVYDSLDEAQATMKHSLQRSYGCPAEVASRHDYPGRFHVVRFNIQNASKDKEYRPFHHNGNGYVIGDPPGPLPLYRRDEIAGEQNIVVVEGEKCADAATGIGMAASSPSHGSKSASKSDWTPLKGKHVAIFPDADAPGEAHAAEVASLAHKAGAASVRIVRLPGLDQGEDIADYIEQRPDEHPDDIRAEIERLIDEAPLWTPSTDSLPQQSCIPKRRFVVKRGSEIETTGIDYLWERRIPMASITVIFSRPGRGKSTGAASFAGHVTTGRNWPDGSPCPRGEVVYVKGEGSDTAMKQRMEGHQADPARYVMVSRTDDDEAAMIDLALDAKLLDEVITPATKLIIIDTLDSLFPSMRMIDNANIRRCLWPLQEIAERRGVAVVILAHTNKGAYADPLDRLSGGRAIGAAARAIWYLGKTDPQADECFMASVKCNDFLPADTISYRIAGIGPDTPGHIVWGGTSDTSAWDLDGPPKSEDHIDKAELCTSWLADLLADGPRPVAEVQKLADALGYGRKVMNKAKSAIDTRTIAQKGTRPPAYWLCLLGQCPPPLRITPEGVTSDSSEITDITPLQPKARGASMGVQASW